MADERRAERLDNTNENDTMNTGDGSVQNTGASGAIPRSDVKRMDDHATQYYEQIRQRTTDVDAIAKNTGLSIEDVQSVKNHVFIERHDLGRKNPTRFDPSYDMAVSWQRLIDGRDIQEMDMVLLKHELHELRLMAQGAGYRDAHIQAELLYNYSQFVQALNLKEGVR